MNITRPLALAAFVALVISACSQPRNLASPIFEPQFGTAASDGAYGLAKHSSGLYVVGSTDGNLHATHKGQGDAYIRKYDTSGRLLWGKQFGTTANDAAEEVATDTSGNAYVFGRTAGNLARALRGRSDFFLRKYSPSGVHLWTKQFGLDTYDSPGGVAVSGGFVYAVGVSEGLGTFVYRLYPDGSTYWKKQVTPAIQFLRTSDLAADGSGNVYVAGSISDPCDDPEFEWPRCTSIRLNKYNSSGTLVWSKRVRIDHRNTVQALATYGSSVYLVEEGFEVPNDNSSTWLVKLNTSGVIQWSEYVGIANANDQYITGRSDNVSADGSGAYVASTATTNYEDPSDSSLNRQAYEVTKFTSDGSEAWRLGGISCCFGDGNERIFGHVSGVLARGGGEVYIAGSVDGGVGRSDDAYLKRLNASTGSTVWTR